MTIGMEDEDEVSAAPQRCLRRRDRSSYSVDAFCHALCELLRSDPLWMKDLFSAGFWIENSLLRLGLLSRRREPWVTPEVEALERQATSAYKRYRRYGHDSLLQDFRTVRSRSGRLYSDLLCEYVRSTIIRCSSQVQV